MAGSNSNFSLSASQSACFGIVAERVEEGVVFRFELADGL